MPPFADTRKIPSRSDEKRMSSRLFHVPASGCDPIGTVQIVCAGPPVRPTFFSLPSAKNATKWLSADQKGCDAPSVPASVCATAESRDRSHSLFVPSGPNAKNATCPPSGDTAVKEPDVLKLVPSGGEIVNTTGVLDGDVVRIGRTPMATRPR